MKIKQLLFTMGMMLSGILSACHLGHDDNTTSIKVDNNNDSYKFSAYYNQSLTRKIEQYIDQQIKPNSVFNSRDHRLDITVILADRTTFHIKSSPGELSIQLDKRANSMQSCNRVSDLCKGIRNLLSNRRAGGN